MSVDYRLSIIDYRMITTLLCNFIKTKIYSFSQNSERRIYNLNSTTAYCPILKSIIYNLNSMRLKGVTYAS